MRIHLPSACRLVCTGILIGMIARLPAKDTGATAWTGCGDLEAASREGRAVTLKARLTSGEPVFFRIDVLSDHLMRVRAGLHDGFEPSLPERDGFVRSTWPPTTFRLQREDNKVTITAGKFQATLSRKPLRFRFSYAGRLLLQESGEGVSWQGDRVRLTMAATPEEHFLGFGDQGAGYDEVFPPDRAPLDHRGRVLVMAGLSSERNYYLPFFMSSRGYGLYLNTLTYSVWDMAKTDAGRYRIEVDEPAVDYYVIAGPELREVLSRYTELLGRPPLPPKWELGGKIAAEKFGVKVDGRIPEEGWNTRWLDQKQIEASARATRRRHISADYLHLDSAWQTIRNSFEWVAEIPAPGRMMALLAQLNFKVGLWQRPTLVQGDYRLYREAAEKGYLVNGADGRPFVCPQKYGGPSAMVDFTNPEAVRWWQGEVRKLVALGASTFKLDSASAGFIESYPEAYQLRFHNGMTGRQMENYYGPLYLKTVWDGLKEALGGRRAVLHVFHQTYFAGGRFPYMGLGDRTRASSRAELIRYALNYGLSGVPFWDGGGFGALGLPGVSQELRMQLIPHTYTYWHRAHETGLPILSALALEYQQIPQSYAADTEFLYGKEFLVAPALKKDQRWRRTYLPPGEWMDYWTQERHLGPGWEHLRVQPEREPILVRGGSIIPMAPPAELAGNQPASPLTLDIYPAGTSEFTLYEDDGATYAYENGAYATTRFACTENRPGVEITIGPTKGEYENKPGERTYILKVNGITRPRKVTVDGSELTELGGEKNRESEAAGWWYRMRSGYERTVWIRLPARGADQDAAVVLRGAAVVRYYRR